MERHVIEVLYSERCRFVPLAIERVRAAVAPKHAELDVEIRLVRIETTDEAILREFPGSPTVRVDGWDVDPEGARFYGLHGRAYLTNGDIDRAPAAESIDAALNAAAARAKDRVGRGADRTSVRSKGTPPRGGSSRAPLHDRNRNHVEFP